jgi:hypothetical protein
MPIKRTSVLIVAALLMARSASAQFGFDTPTKLDLTLPQALHATLDAYGSFLSDALVINVLASQVTTFPLGSSSGAFTFTYDVGTRTFRRRSTGLGPWYAERATTLGRRHAFEVGSATQFTRYRGLDGRDLDDDVLFTLTRTPTGEIDSGSYLNLSLSQRITSLSATYALSQSVDVRFVVPLVSTRFHGIVRDETGEIFAGTFARSSRPGSGDFAGFTAAIADFGPVTDTGIGDVQARAKWNFLRSSRLDAAAQVELRLPTGDYYALTGTDAWRQKMSALFTAHLGPLEQHVNIGYTFRLSGATLLEAASQTLREQQGATANELSYAAGTEWAPTARLSLTAELLGRFSRDSIVFRHSVQNITNDDGSLNYVDESTSTRVANVHQRIGAIGAKYVLYGNTLLSAHLLFSLNRAGLTVRPSPVIGIEHAF